MVCLYLMDTFLGYIFHMSCEKAQDKAIERRWLDRGKFSVGRLLLSVVVVSFPLPKAYLDIDSTKTYPTLKAFFVNWEDNL